jgi:hypothetical protein
LKKNSNFSSAFGWSIRRWLLRVLVEEKLQLFFSLWLVNSSLVAESSG